MKRTNPCPRNHEETGLTLMLFWQSSVRLFIFDVETPGALRVSMALRPASSSATGDAIVDVAPKFTLGGAKYELAGLLPLRSVFKRKGERGGWNLFVGSVDQCGKDIGQNRGEKKGHRFQQSRSRRW